MDFPMTPPTAEEMWKNFRELAKDMGVELPEEDPFGKYREKTNEVPRQNEPS
jgi:hypothetical protein